MTDAPDGNPPNRNYKWPWFVLAAVVVFIVLAVVWVSIAAKKVEQERIVNTLIPTNSR